MFNINITEAELNKIDWMDKAIKYAKSDEDKLKKEKSDKNKILAKRRSILSSVNSKPFENKVYINSLPGKFSEKWIDKKDVTEEMAEKELEIGFRN